MKLPNSYGSVYKLSGKRRNPYVARKTVGWKTIPDKKKAQPIYEFIGYYPTKAEALQALAEYNANPYDINASKITFGEVYDRWSKQHFEKISASNVNGVKAAYKLCDSIKEMPMIDIKLSHLQSVVDNSGKNQPTLRKLKAMLGMVYQYAVINEIVPQDKHNFIKFLDISKAGNPNALDRKPFSKANIDELWAISEDDEYSSIVLMLLYSGCRISELLNLRKKDVNIEERWFDIIQSKTVSGIRKVPIADKVLPFFKHWMSKDDGEYLITRIDGSRMTYDSYYKDYWQPLINKRMMTDLTPHCTRHTTVSRLTEAGIDERIIQKIVGHKGETVTTSVYTHLEIETMLDAINKI